MGDKNNLTEVLGSDLLIKTGHGIIKSIYCTPGDRTWILRDGVTVGGVALFTIAMGAVGNGTLSMPYINHPCRDGIFVDNTAAGTLGSLIIIWE